MTVDQDVNGSYQMTLPTGIDVVYHGALDHQAFDVTIRDLTKIVYGNAQPVPVPYGSVAELRAAISSEPVLFAHEAVVHASKWRHRQTTNP